MQWCVNLAQQEHATTVAVTMTKASKGKDKKIATNKSKFKEEDKVFAMDGGDLYEAKVGHVQI